MDTLKKLAKSIIYSLILVIFGSDLILETVTVKLKVYDDKSTMGVKGRRGRRRGRVGLLVSFSYLVTT